MRLRTVLDPRTPYKLRHLLRPPGIPKKLLRRYLPDDPVIVEAGAHDGSDTAEMARMWPAATVHAFEPIPDVFKKLEERTGRLPNVRRYREALGPTDARVAMWVSSGGSDSSSSVLTPERHLDLLPEVTFEGRIEVPAITLDEFARRERLARVDFLWLDLQGYELAALSSGEETLDTVTAIVCEVSTVPYFEGGVLWPTLRSWLCDRGFSVAVLNMAWGNAGDALFLKE